MIWHIVALGLLGALISIDGIHAYKVYKTSTVQNKKPLLVIHYVLLAILTFFVFNSVLSVFKLTMVK
ncbi:MAG: hypothetical protein ABH868_01495 [bacterium]